jgi:hypothetical protein
VSVECFDCEPCDTQSTTRVRARKTHTCECCDQQIRPGDYYFRDFLAWEGTCEVVKRCPACQLIYRQLNAMMTDDEAADRRLGCGHEFREKWGREPPAELARLAFATPEEKNQLVESGALDVRLSHYSQNNLRYTRQLFTENGVEGFYDRAGNFKPVPATDGAQ